ncbi:APC family permease [Streptomyces sp. YKOK-J1]
MEHTTSSPQLKKSLGVVDGVVLAASSTAATTSIGIGMGVLASITGRQTPLILLLGFLPMLGIASAYARLNKAEPNCGAGYTWVGRSMGPWLGMIAGWVPLAGGVVFLAYTTSVTGSVLVQCAHKAGIDSLLGRHLDANSTLQCTLIGLLVLAAVTVTAVTGVNKATRLQTCLLVFEYAVLLVFSCWGLIAGDQPFSLSWFSPFAFGSPSALAQGLVLAVFFYWGWDAAFSVTEETKQAGDAARGSYIALFTMLGLFLLDAVAFQRVMTASEMSGTGAQGLTYYASRLADEPWATLPLIALMFSAVAVLTVVIPKLNEAILAAVNAIGILVALYYGLTAIACALRFRGLVRASPREAVMAVLVPSVCAALLFALGAYLVLYYATLSDTFAISVDNGWFNLLCPMVILATGLVVSAVAKWYRRAPAFAPATTPGITVPAAEAESLP